VPIITLDGPAASGKSSVARALAARLGIAYVSSGLLYRAVALLSREAGIDLTDESAVLELLAARTVKLVPVAGANRVEVDGIDVEPRLHTDDVDGNVSDVARLPLVRQWVKDRLRELEGPFVIDGRDMGTTVFPGARWKFYLTAPTEVRARRRVGERAADIEAVTAALSRRDERDARQSVPAADAVHIDTGPLSLGEVVDAVHDAVIAAWPGRATPEP
jgi:cytidylate kinase